MAYSSSSNERNFMKETLKHYGYSATDIDSVLTQHSGRVKFEVALQELQDLKNQRRIMLTSNLPIEAMDTVIISSDSDSSDVEMPNEPVLRAKPASKQAHNDIEVSDTALKCAMLDLPPVQDLLYWIKKNYLVAQFESVGKEDFFADFCTYFQRPNYAELNQVFFNELSAEIVSKNQEYEDVWMSGENTSGKIWGLKPRKLKQTLQRDINGPATSDFDPTTVSTAQKDQQHIKPEFSRGLYSMPSTSLHENIAISSITEPKVQSKLYPTLPHLPSRDFDKNSTTKKFPPAKQQKPVDSKKSISKTIQKVFQPKTTLEPFAQAKEKPRPVPLPRNKAHSPIHSSTAEKISAESFSSKIQDLFKPLSYAPSTSKKELAHESSANEKPQQNLPTRFQKTRGALPATNSKAVSRRGMRSNSPSKETSSYESVFGKHLDTKPVRLSHKVSSGTEQSYPAIAKPVSTRDPYLDKAPPVMKEPVNSSQHASSAVSSSHKPNTKQLLDLPNIPGQPDLRPIVIDGSNVACCHGNSHKFSCRGIAICVRYFWLRGHRDITCFVPNFRKGPSGSPPITEQHVLYNLEQQGICKFTPSRKVNGVNKICYDDRFILRLAETNGGVVVSNDQYRDLKTESPQWKQVIENRLLMFVFVHDLFMPPDDPLGSGGPHLDDFLSFPNRAFQNIPSSHRIVHRKDQYSMSPKQPVVDHTVQAVSHVHHTSRDELAAELRVLFPGLEETIDTTLRLHPRIHDLNILADLICEPED